MRALLFLLIISFTFHALAFETTDKVLGMEKVKDEFHVSFGTMARIYKIKTTDKNVQCLETSALKKSPIKVSINMKKGIILKCKGL
jgi:hypothetical protein